MCWRLKCNTNFLFQIFRHITTSLINRFVTFVRGILFGQIQSKALRLSATDARDRAPSDLMDSHVNEIVVGFPDMLEIIASAVEIGAIISYLTGCLGVASFVGIIPALCTLDLAPLCPFLLF